jgi:hypothetical protein
MNVAVEARATRQQPPHRPTARSMDVSQVQPGWRFKKVGDDKHVFALISHRDQQVDDTSSRRWCVVVDTNDLNDECVVGELLPLPANTPVQLLREIRRPQYAVL